MMRSSILSSLFFMRIALFTALKRWTAPSGNIRIWVTYYVETGYTLTMTYFCIWERMLMLLAIWSPTLVSRTRPNYSALGKSKLWCCDTCYVIVKPLPLPQQSFCSTARYLVGHGKKSLRYPRLTPRSLSTASPYTQEKPNRYRDNKFRFAAHIGF
jgi:hypothetical protein